MFKCITESLKKVVLKAILLAMNTPAMAKKLFLEVRSVACRVVPVAARIASIKVASVLGAAAATAAGVKLVEMGVTATIATSATVATWLLVMAAIGASAFILIDLLFPDCGKKEFEVVAAAA